MYYILCIIERGREREARYREEERERRSVSKYENYLLEQPKYDKVLLTHIWVSVMSQEL